MSDELPQGWASTSLDELIERTRGVSYTRGEASLQQKQGLIPILRANNIANDRLNFDELVYVPPTRVSERQRIRKGDIVIAMSSGSKSVVGKTAQALQDWNGAFGAFCGVLRPSRHLNRRYIALFLRTRNYRDRISELAAGTNINNLKAEHFEQIEVPLAPLNEQRRIVAKLEKLLGKVDVAQQRLTKIPVLLKRFRQSVLAAACSGRLTAYWRDKRLSKDVGEPESSPTNYDSLTDDSDLPDLPEGWQWVRFGSVICELRNGISRRPKIDPPGMPILRISSTRPGNIDLTDVRYMPGPQEFLPTYAVRDGDLFFTRYNGSIELLGVCGMVRGLGKRTLLYPDKLMRVRLSKGEILPSYVEIFFSASEVHERVVAKAKSSAGQNGVSGTDIKAQPFALPSLAEQKEIVRRVEEIFALADQIAARYAKAKASTGKLTQSLLAKAFRGELVPQDPNDEPASVLLERIKEQRNSSPNNTYARKKTKKESPSRYRNTERRRIHQSR